MEKEIKKMRDQAASGMPEPDLCRLVPPQGLETLLCRLRFRVPRPSLPRVAGGIGADGQARRVLFTAGLRQRAAGSTAALEAAFGQVSAVRAGRVRLRGAAVDVARRRARVRVHVLEAVGVRRARLPAGAGLRGPRVLRRLAAGLGAPVRREAAARED